MRSETLGDSLRRHREETIPTDGLAAAPRRRVKGLRRSEVASLLGITEQWYTMLERGRAPTTSARILEKLRDVFGLSPAESERLFALAGKAPPERVSADSPRIPTALEGPVDRALLIETGHA